MSKVALITGITGQDGSYLCELLLEKGYQVHGLIRRSSIDNLGRINQYVNDSEVYNQRLFLHFGDLTDANGLQAIVNQIQPEEVYNLGAQSHVKVSFATPEYTAQVDALGCLRLLDAVYRECPRARFYQASTSEMCGGQLSEMPPNGFREDIPFHPRSPYGVAKVYAYWITRNYRESYDMYACNGILFNHESARRGENFVTRKITRWFANYCNQKFQQQVKPVPLHLGNLNARRDWGHAKDFVDAQWQILQQQEPDDYLIATGKTHSVRDFVEQCFHLVGKNIVWTGEGIHEQGLVDGQVAVCVDPEFFRPAEVDVLLGDATKARTQLGWEPKYDFADLVEDMVRSGFELAHVDSAILNSMKQSSLKG